MASKNEIGLDEETAEVVEIPEKEPEVAQKEVKPKRRLSKKKRNLIIVVVVISVALIVGLWGLSPSNYLTVGDVVNHPEIYIDKTIEVKGAVENWNSNAKTFNLSDGVSTLTVVYTILPEGFNNGKDVVVKGTLENDGGLVMNSMDVQVGCPSKY